MANTLIEHAGFAKERARGYLGRAFCLNPQNPDECDIEQARAIDLECGLLAVYEQVALSARAEEAVAHLTRGINTYHEEEVTVAGRYGRWASFHFENRDWSAAVGDYREASGVLRRTDQRPQVRNNPKLEFFGKLWSRNLAFAENMLVKQIIRWEHAKENQEMGFQSSWEFLQYFLPSYGQSPSDFVP